MCLGWLCIDSSDMVLVLRLAAARTKFGSVLCRQVKTLLALTVCGGPCALKLISVVRRLSAWLTTVRGRFWCVACLIR